MKIITLLLSLIPLALFGQAVEGSAGRDSDIRSATYTPPAAGAVGHGAAGVNAQLTDEEHDLVKGYKHEGYLKRDYDSKCAEAGGACSNKAASATGNAVADTMIETIAKSYSLVVGQLPDATYATKAPVEGEKAADKEKVTDYCRYIPLATEGVAATVFGVKQSSNQLTTAQEDTDQKNMLYKTANSHASRADAAKIQVIGWGTTTACYTAQAAQAAYIGWAGSAGDIAKGSWPIYAKAAAAGFLTWFYANKMYASIEARDATRETANKLKGPGSCNPVTDRSCYCSQTETENDANYCLPQILASRAKQNAFTLTCTTNELKDDPNCNCISTNSCFNTKLADIQSKITLGSGIKDAENAAAINMFKGSLGTAEFDSSAAKFAAKAKKQMQDAAAKLPDPTTIPTLAQKAQINEMTAMGVPSKLAYQLATRPADANSNKFKSMAGGYYIPKSYGNAQASGRANDNVLRFTEGGASGPRGLAPSPDARRVTKAQVGGRSTDSNVLSFAEKASASADINKDSDRPLFEIISHRYQLSGQKRLLAQ